MHVSYEKKNKLLILINNDRGIMHFTTTFEFDSFAICMALSQDAKLTITLLVGNNNIVNI